MEMQPREQTVSKQFKGAQLRYHGWELNAGPRVAILLRRSGGGRCVVAYVVAVWWVGGW